MEVVEALLQWVDVRIIYGYWFCVLLAYGIKFLYSPLDEVTSYGKFQKSIPFYSSVLYPASARSSWIFFYQFGLCWNSVLLLVLWWMKLVYHIDGNFTSVWVINIMFEFQLARRLYESLFVTKFSQNNLHIVNLLAGISIYLFAPASFMVEILGKSSLIQSASVFKIASIISLILLASYCQSECHKILARLRSAQRATPSRHTTYYAIPHGNLFEYVSCPHYFAEIVIYLCFVLLSEGASLAIWMIFGFVTLNLTHSAIRTHSWYKKKFAHYPSSRKALIPLLL